MITAKRTHDFYIRYTNGLHKWYKAIIFAQLGRIRVTKKSFDTASEALKYRDRLLRRILKYRRDDQWIIREKSM